MIVVPAIDIRGGKVVRLRQGRSEDETTYGHDPAEAARRRRPLKRRPKRVNRAADERS